MPRCTFIQLTIGVILLTLLQACSSTDIRQIVDRINPFPSRPHPTDPGLTAPGWHRNITATYFDIAQYNPPQTAWNDMDPLQENPYYLALPMNNRVPGMSGYGECKNRWVEIVSAATGKKAFGQWEDVGPWVVNDAAYVFDDTGQTRPFAEIYQGQYWNIYCEQSGTGARKPRKILNDAGIDLSPLLAQALEIRGKGKVHWRFVDAAQVTPGPWTQRISTTPPHYRKKSFTLFNIEYKHWERTTTLRQGLQNEQ
jgi:hypothetical protein